LDPILIIGILLVLLLLGSGAPIFVAFGAGAIIVLVYVVGLPTSQLAAQFFAAVDKGTLLAIPFFILAGILMVEGRSAKGFINFFMSFLGHIHGGLAIAVIVSCAFFGAISGSAIATAVAVGAFLIPEMTKRGYPIEFSTAVVACGGMLGIIIPPSLTLIILADITAVGTGELFAAGMVPGIFTAVLMCIPVYLMCRGKDYGITPRQSWNQRWQSFLTALPGLMMPVFVLGSIYSGVCTPTEAAMIASVYAIIIGFYPYKGLRDRTALSNAVRGTVRASATIYFIIGSAVLMGILLTFLQIPQNLTVFLSEMHISPLAFTLMVAVVFIGFGMIFEAVVIHYVIVPLLLPVIALLGIDLVPFCIMLTINTMVGNITPPVCVTLYGACSITNADPSKVIKYAIPILISQVVAMVIIILVPSMSTFLPNLMGL